MAAWTLLLLAGSACADDAAWTYVGGAGNFSHNSQIRMASERVDIRLLDKRSHFRATFVFRNEGPATTVTMAFPEEKHGDKKPRGAIHDFFSSVDGIGVKVTRKRLPPAEYATNDYSAVWLKKVRFGAHQTRHVLVDYWADNGDIGDVVSNKYVLKTGATWKGKIGDCVIHVDWSGFHGLSDPIFFLDHESSDDTGLTRETARRRTFHFRNFEPDFDLLMDWTNTFANFEVNGDLIDCTGLSNDRVEYVLGSDSDPKVAIRYAPQIFGEPVDDPEDQDGPQVGTPFSVGSHKVRVLGDRTVEIDGKTVKLRRSGGIEDDQKCIYVRDLVRALGGTFRYSRKLDRDIIWVK
jgi:hypothetical protein